MAGVVAILSLILGLAAPAGAEGGREFQLSLVREGDLIAIGGVLPDEAAKAALADAIRAAAGEIATIDMTEIRAEAPPAFREAGIWAASVVARLKPGAVLVEGQAVTVEGQPDGPSGSEAVRAALASPPAGFSVRRQAVAAPRVSPFALTLTRSGDGVRMAGVVASEAEAADLAAFARSLGLNPEGMPTMAAGAPDGIDRMAAARFALVQLARLKAGEARLADRSLAITGEPADRAAFVAVNRALRDGPGPAIGVTLSGRIAAPVIAPFRWEAVKRDGRVVLRGYVPSDADRAEIRAAAEALAAPDPVTDEQELASGAPAGFVTAAIAGLGHLALVESGAARIEGVALFVTGRVPDAASQAAARSAIAGSAPFGFTASATLTAPAPPPPPPAPPACLAAITAELAQGGIVFRTSRDVMEPASQSRLDRVAQAMNTCPRVRFTVVGHTDSDGIAAQNVDLSQRRAQAVVAYLIRRGVEAGRLLAEGLGATRPLVPNDSAANKARNRRIEILAR
jgi:OOP family OmpA-OmpF porin